jgi:hypothetical protein
MHDKKLNFMDQYTFTSCLGAHGTWNPTITLPLPYIYPSIQAGWAARGGEIRFAYVNYEICSESNTEKR